MDKKILVDEYINEGKKLIKELDDENFPISAALWFYFVDGNYWKLLIASSKLDEEGPIEAYMDIQNAMAKTDIKDIKLDDISLIRPSYDLIFLLKSAIVTGRKDISGIKFTANTINNTYIEDAYIYRMT